MTANDIEDIRHRMAAIEGQQSVFGANVAVLQNQMAGVIRLLWMILSAVVVGMVGMILTAWVKVPS